MDINAEIRQNLSPCGSFVTTFDQKFQRFDIDKNGDKAGWLIGSEWTYNGNTYQSCFYGSWKTGVQLQWKSWQQEEEIIDAKFRAKMVREQAKQKQIIELQKNKANHEAAVKARRELELFEPANVTNWYAKKKGISEFGDALTSGNDLIIPIYDAPQNLVGYQRITEKGKYFLKGQKVAGTYNLMGSPTKSKLMYVAEGFATASTIYEATGTPCLVAFNCHNLGDAISNFAEHYPGKRFVIAADKDSSGAGEKAAKEVCASNPNVKYILPKLESGSDFNDLYLEKGIKEVAEQLSQISADDFIYVDLLGFVERRFYFFSARSQIIYDFSYPQIKNGELVEIADERYWLNNYFQKKTREGKPTGKCDWEKTAEFLVRRQHEIGKLDINNMKGFGAWIDGKKTVINTGSKLYVNGVERAMSNRDGLKNIYCYSDDMSVDLKKKHRVDFTPLIDALELVDFDSEQSRMFIIGFLVHACCFSAQPWRTHLWFSGEHGTGKSTVMSFIRDFLVNAILTQDSSAAGVKQSLGKDATVVLADEAENEVATTKQLVALAKQSSSGNSTKVLRGTAGGQAAVQFVPNVLFCFGSIRKSEMTVAESSRIVDVGMKKVRAVSSEKEERRVKLMDEAVTMGSDLFVHVSKNIGTIKNLEDQIKPILIEKGFGSRFSDTYSNLLSGYALLSGLSAGEVVEKMVNNEMEQDILDSVENENDSNLFFDDLMGIFLDRIDGENVTLREAIGNALGQQDELGDHLGGKRKRWAKILERYGINIHSGFVSFDSHSNNLRSLLRKQTIYGNLERQMKSDPVRFLKKPVKLRGSATRRWCIESALV